MTTAHPVNPAEAPVDPPKAPAPPTGGTGATNTPGGWDFALHWDGSQCRSVGCRCGWQQQLPDPTEAAAITAWQRHHNDRTH